MTNKYPQVKRCPTCKSRMYYAYGRYVCAKNCKITNPPLPNKGKDKKIN